MNGIVLLNKPAGMTSFTAVKKVSRLFNEKKAGHTGTLDPNATGLMIILLGRCTKLVPYALADHKVYKATFRLGVRTDTEDIWGEVLEEKEYQEHSEEELLEACKKLTGDIEQLPPMYSAIKKDGKKLYEYARAGKTVEREKRQVHIEYLCVKSLGNGEYEMEADVSSGTYIRTLIADFCELIDEIGTMTSLVRESISSLSLSEASTLEEIEEGKVTFIDEMRVIDPSWRIVECKMPEMVRNGRSVYLNNIEDEHVIFVYEDHLLAAYEKRDDDRYHCVRGLE